MNFLTFDRLNTLNIIIDENEATLEKHIRSDVKRNLRENLDISCDAILKEEFRVNGQVLNYLESILDPVMRRPHQRRGSITPRQKILMTLKFLAQGSYQLGVANDIHLSTSQSMVSKSISEVIDAMNTYICPEVIKFPNTEEMNAIAARIQAKHNIPGVIGYIDGTQISVVPQAIKKETEFKYINRKGFHSLNVQIVVDDNYEIRSINAKHCGRAHDASIWKVSDVREYLSRTLERGSKMWLLGDSGYPLEPWLLVPFKTPHTLDENHFNDVHSTARSTVERSIGVLKGRWRCLKLEKGLHYAPSKAVKIINCCAALHNLSLRMDDEYLDILVDMERIMLNECEILDTEVYQLGNQNRLYCINRI